MEFLRARTWVRWTACDEHGNEGRWGWCLSRITKIVN